MLNELTELQSLDFAFGAYLAGAFAGYADKGPEGWRNFIKRPVNKQIFRHDADTPEQFMRDFLSSQKDRKVTETETVRGHILSQTTVNSPLFPVVYYFRKPGLVNTQDQQGAHRKVWIGDRRYDLKLRQIAIDYSLVFLAWDKLALDKLCLAWYNHVYDNDAFAYPCQIGSDVFDIRVALPDNKNVVIQNATDVADGKRLYAAAATPVSIHTSILMGREIDPPGPSRIIFGGAHEDERQYTVSGNAGVYLLDTAQRDGSTAINPGSVKVLVGARVVAVDDCKGEITGSFEQNDAMVTVAGTVDYYNGVLSWGFTVPPAGTVSGIFRPLQGRAEAGEL